MDPDVAEPDDLPPGEVDEPPPTVVEELRRVTEDALGDPGSIASRRVLGQVFERELDLLHTPAGSSVFSDRRPSRSDEDRKRREERLMMAAVTRAAGEVLRGHGIRIRRSSLDGETEGGGGYVLVAYDSAGREFEARFGLELAEKLVSGGGHANLVERMGQAVAREVLGARERYFRRMGTS